MEDLQGSLGNYWEGGTINLKSHKSFGEQVVSSTLPFPPLKLGE